jgi:enoyl-CoA hydratase
MPQTTNESPLRVERRGQALWLTLNRPEAYNSLTVELIAALNAALTEAEQDPAIRVTVITGSGKAFCAGANLKMGSPDQTLEEFNEAGNAFVASALAFTQRLERSPKLVIAAINGVAVAGGLEITLACDLVYAVQGSRIGDAHANFGLVPGGGSTARLPAKVGINRANYLMYTGDILPAETLFEWGLVNKVVPQGELITSVDELVENLCAKSPIGLSRMKQLMRDSQDMALDAALQSEHNMLRLHGYSFDRKEGLDAFAEKRTPQFIGR